MSEENNTAQSDENAVNNPSTEASKNNVEQSVPLSRFSEVNNKAKEMADELQQYKAKEAQRVEAEKVARGEFESVLAEKDKLIQQQAPLVEEWKTYTTNRRATLLDSLPEDKRMFGDSMKDLSMLEKFVETEVKNVPVNAGKIESPRQGVTPAGEFGGYSSIEEWASKDPKGYKQERNKVNGITIAYGG